MNPWIIVGFLVALIGAFFYGQHVGAAGEKAAWEQRENKELVAKNAKILELEEAARNTEHAHAAELDLIATTHQGEMDAARLQKERDVAAARSGALKLRIPSNCERPAGSQGSGVAAAPGVGDGAETIELPATITADLFALADDADEIVQQLTACQAVVREDRRLISTPR